MLRERTTVADTLEAALAPIDPPAVSGWRITPLYKPAPTAAHVGGDFYDAYRVGDGWMIVVGDVVGHGAPAAALVGLVRYTLRTAATLTGSVGAAVRKLDSDLLERDRLDPCALACIRLTPDSDEALIMVAGTPPPLAVRGGVASECASPGSLVGAFAGAEWREVRLTVPPGDLVVLQTDGAIDVRGRDGRFGMDGVRKALDGALDGAAQGLHYLVMEYVEGQDLSSLVKAHGPLPVETAVNYITQAVPAAWRSRIPRGSFIATSSRPTCSWTKRELSRFSTWG